MNYWHNPKITCTHTVLPHPVDTDPVVASSHGGEHVLLYDPGVHKARIDYSRTVQDQCNWLNESMDIWHDPYRIATIVKLNIYIEDIKRQGVVKPMLLYYDGEEKFGLHTGENRMRATELMPELDQFECFITTHVKYADKFNLPHIENFEQFTEICRTDIGCQYQFTLTDKDAPYGMYWFEYDSDRTRAVTPTYDWCETVMRNYLKANDITFTPKWFDTIIDWKNYE